MKIFIGSSIEGIELVRHIEVWLEELNIMALPWDEPGLFIPGSNTFHRLIEISKQVDAAIFIFSEDDKVWYRSDAVSQPRDNILIEYGLFTGSLGAHRAIILKNGGYKSASDLLGISFIDVSEPKRSRGKLEVRIWCQNLSKESNVENKIELLTSKQDIILQNNLLFEDFKNNVIYNFNKYRAYINATLLEDLKKIEGANFEARQYPDDVKSKMKEYLLFYEYFGILLKTVSREEFLLEEIDYFALGMASYLENKLEEAKFFLEKSTEMNKNNYIAMFKLGGIYYMLNNYTKAIECFNKVISVNPNFVLSYYNKGIMFTRLKMYQEATIEFKNAIRIDDKCLSAYNNLAGVYISCGKYDAASEVLDKLLSLDDTYFKAYYNKACLFSEQKNKNMALQYLKKAITFDAKVSQIAMKDTSFGWLTNDSDFIELLNL